ATQFTTTSSFCVPSRVSTAVMTLTRFDPTFGDAPFIAIPFGRTPPPTPTTRNVQLEVTVENLGTAPLPVSTQNWCLTDGSRSFVLLSTPSSVLYGTTVAINGRVSGPVAFQNVPRITTNLVFEAKFDNQTNAFLL